MTKPSGPRENMTNDKPREFWIRSSAMVDSFDREFRQAFTVPTHPDSDEIHVIEISAYRELERLFDENKNVFAAYTTELKAQINDLEAKNQELERELQDVRGKLDRSAIKYDPQYLNSHAEKVEDAVVVSLARVSDLEAKCAGLEREYLECQNLCTDYRIRIKDLEAKLQNAVSALEHYALNGWNGTDIEPHAKVARETLARIKAPQEG